MFFSVSNDDDHSNSSPTIDIIPIKWLVAVLSPKISASAAGRGMKITKSYMALEFRFVRSSYLFFTLKQVSSISGLVDVIDGDGCPSPEQLFFVYPHKRNHKASELTSSFDLKMAAKKKTSFFFFFFYLGRPHLHIIRPTNLSGIVETSRQQHHMTRLRTSSSIFEIFKIHRLALRIHLYNALLRESVATYSAQHFAIQSSFFFI